MKDNQNQTQVVSEQQDYIKSNFLISSKYKSTLLENKIMAISLSHMAEAVEDSDSGAVISRIKASEIMKMLNKKGGSFYDQLKAAAESMTGKSICMEDRDREVFDFISVIIRATYKDGIFSIEYNPHIKKYIKNIRQNFTILNLPTMLDFKSVYSFRLYELLKSKAYRPKNSKVQGNTYRIEFLLSELKLDLGVVNADSDKVKRALKSNGGKIPDYDKAVDIAPDKMFSAWQDFKRYVLNTAIEEINEKTEIVVEYDTVKAGKGGKVYQINFLVTFKDDEDAKAKGLSDEEKEGIIDEIYDMLNGKLKMKDVKAVAAAADYNIKKVEKAYEAAEKSKHIKNLTGYLISAVTEGYELIEMEDKAAASKKRKKKNSFNDIMETDYDVSEIEKLIIANEN